MSATKTFGIGPILTVTTGSLMCDLGDLYGILGWLTGEDLMTHQLPRASREAEGPLCEWFPDLATVTVPEWSALPGWGGMSDDQKRANIESWLADLGSKVGAEREVPRLNADDHTSIDPLAETQMMRPDLPIIPVIVRDEGGDR